jgi:N6-adenosine-specific RNA methylase IME4
VKFDILYADPPWHYNARNNHSTRFGGGMHAHYKPMSYEALSTLPVADVTADNALLFLWVTNPRLRVGISLLEAWGFSYVTTAFHWMKLNPVDGKPFFGIGHYTKSGPEICLLGRRGKALHPNVNTVSSLVIAPRTRHSEKPAIVRDRIAEMYPYARRVEFFARAVHPGWTCLGDEIDGWDIDSALRTFTEPDDL